MGIEEESRMSAPVQTPPVLRAGDRLSRDEFERRYHAMPPDIKAELIEGVVHMPSPVRIRSHGTPHYLLGTWITIYWGNTPGTLGGGDATVRLDPGNEPQPDGVLMRVSGGTARIDEDDYITGSPELVAEIGASSAGIDRTAKFRAYQRNGIQEYVLILPLEGRIDWFALRDGAYEPLAADAEGIVRSEAFPGLWLDPEAFLRLEVATVLATLQRGLASPEHTAFAESLRGENAS